ncbi:MAG TPA: DUF1206 domain-containing protein [Longimicrobiales bacterium]|nr:DUF1206 domain-containing protein [Longimicrobiales bacterium]
MNATQVVDELAVQASPWVQRLARFGFLSKGLVYMLVGVLAVQAAVGRSEATGSRGALRELLGAPLGSVLLGAIAIGLFGYALWRAYCAIADPERDGGWHRLYCAGVAVVHASIAVEAARLALTGIPGGEGDGGAQHWTATGLSQPFGGWIVGGVGGAIIVWGLAQLVKAWRAKLDDQLELGRLRPTTRTWVRRISRFGIAARGVVFAVAGIHLVRAALQFDASEARDAGGALRALEQQPMGPWLLGVVAAGLFAYGIYELLRARYRVIHLGGRGAGAAIRLERG